MNFDDTARFFGPSDRLWPELFRPPQREIKRVCLGCRRSEMRPRQKYCPKCYLKHRNELRRAAGAGREVAELGEAPLQAEALTNAQMPSGYNYHPVAKTPLTESLKLGA
jgi:hypothetical protein